MLEFPEGYFEKEIRDGFEITSMMKKAWAGQLEVLDVIRKICDRHNIRWFADYGTLLGTVREKGFITWDDDMDIGMTRDQLCLFIKYAKDELPDGFKLLCCELEPQYDSLIARVVNSTSVSTDDKRLKQFHGCPYVLGIDIFPMDYLPRNKDERDMVINVVDILLGAVEGIVAPDADPDEVESYLSSVEQMLGVPFDRTRPLKNMIYLMVERIAASYGPDDADEVTGIWRYIWQKELHFPKEWFIDLKQMPFEIFPMNVPDHYHEILSVKYGANYMTPVKSKGHGYPFYKKQELILSEKLGFIPE